MAAPTQSNQQVLAEIEAEWGARLKALETFVDTLTKNYIDDTSNNDRDVTIKPLLLRTKSFGRQIYTFFVNGAYPGYIIRNLPPDLEDPVDPKISVESIPTIILDQIAKDLSVFWNAFQQRIVAALTTRRPQPTIVSETLILADHLAWSAKLMVDDYIRGEETTTVLSLLEARAQVRLVPYAPIAVIGIPMTAVRYFGSSEETTDNKAQSAKEFLGIPHEFAHYVYWYGKVPNTDKLLRECLQVKLAALATAQGHNAEHARVGNWVEEIFADVVGCLIGGPAVALSLQEMMAGGNITDFYTDNGAHPINTVRPFILTQTLRQMEMDDIAEQLQKQWKDKLMNLQKDIAQLAAIDLSSKEPTDWVFPVFVQEKQEDPIRLKTLDDVIRQILALVKPTSLESSSCWTRGDSGSVAGLYKEFYDYIEDHYIQAGALKRLPQEMNQGLTESLPPFGNTVASLLSTKSQVDLQEAAQNISQPSWQEIVSEGAEKITEAAYSLEISADVWNELLTFGGWTSEIDRSPRLT
jgi:hypothetical protein